MKHFLTFTTLLCLPLFAQSVPDTAKSALDMIRFTGKANHDTLHGKFHGFTDAGTVRFKSSEAEEPILFSTKKLHRITMTGGRAEQSLAPTSAVTLINGDIIPGKIISVDEKNVSLETQHMGTITLPSDTVKTITPTPHGGKLLYHGPMNPEGWETIFPPTKKDAEEKEDDKEEKKEDGKDKKKEDDGKWTYIAGAWYAGSNKECYLTLKDALKDRCKVSFNLAWRGSLYCNVALHADFDPPKYEGEKDIRNNMAATVGRGYVVSISAHSATLYECTFDEDNEPISKRITRQHVSMNLSREGDARIEFRLDRPNKALLLYVNDSFKCKWDLGEKYAGTGNHLAFRSLRYSNAELRVSEVMITGWNGLKDSALSMQSDKRDVILLNNGVDRFSGTFNKVQDGQVFFRGTFDNDLTIPLNDVQEIHLASNKLRKLPEDDDAQSVRFHIHPFGRISGKPSADTNGRTKIQTGIVGDLSLEMKYVNLIDFSNQNSLLDFWNENF